MTDIHSILMHKLYGKNIWNDYEYSGAPDAVEGWNGDHPSLSRLAATPGEKVIIDVGVWKGQSTITLANAMRDQGIDGCVISVDTFLGSPEHHSDPTFTREIGRPNLYSIFLSNVAKHNLQNYIIPFPQTSITAAAVLKELNINADIIHVDAAHEYQEALNDCLAYWKILKVGGFMIGDDYSSTWPGIIKAAAELSAIKVTPLSIEYPKWIMNKLRDD